MAGLLFNILTDTFTTINPFGFATTTLNGINDDRNQPLDPSWTPMAIPTVCWPIPSQNLRPGS